MWRLQLPDGRSLPLRTLPATLGRDDAAVVRVRHASIAPLHARLRATPDGRLVVEAVGEAVLQSGGHAVRVVTLDDGDELVLGALAFVARRDAAAQPAPHDELAVRGGPTPGPTIAGAVFPAAGVATTGVSAGDAPAAHGAPSAAEPQLQRRNKGPLVSRKPPPKDGLLHADLGQLSGSRRLVLLLGLLVLAGALAGGIALIFSAVR